MGIAESVAKRVRKKIDLFVHCAGLVNFEPDLRDAIVARWRAAIGEHLPAITEDTMPGELANIIAGRVANLLNLRGPSFTTDAACASTTRSSPAR